MISTEELTKAVQRYREHCQVNNRKPTYNGMGGLLGISGMTVHNVVSGLYNHKPYGSKPHATRCIANDDFEVIQELFDREDKYYE